MKDIMEDINNKLGVIVCPGYSKSPIKNIGDYVQSYAALQFLPNGGTPVLIDRENVDKFQSNERVKTIMNGWWLGNPKNFPPTEAIHPLYVAFHLTPSAANLFFSPETIAHLKKYQPIGCRDIQTVRLMKERGIEAYYSACLTLTLGKSFKHKLEDISKVCFVDPYYEKFLSKHIVPSILTTLRSLVASFLKFRTICKISKSMKSSSNRKYSRVKYFFIAGRFYTTYSPIFTDELLRNAEYEEHSVLKADYPTDEERLSVAKNLLQKYANAKFVVTSRIHCGLPCLGIGTPTIFISSERLLKTGRLSGLVDLFKKVYYKNGRCSINLTDLNLSKKIDENFAFENKKDFEPFAKDLEEKVTNFLN